MPNLSQKSAPKLKNFRNQKKQNYDEYEDEEKCLDAEKREGKKKNVTERDGLAVNGLLEGVAAGLDVVAEGRQALAEARYRRFHLSPSGLGFSPPKFPIQRRCAEFIWNSNNCAGILLVLFSK